jgi:hypothetical protein
MAETDIPNFSLYAEGQPISPVDPEDIQHFWKLQPPYGPGNDQQSACSPGAETAAVYPTLVHDTNARPRTSS